MFYSRGKAASKAVTINLINSPDVHSRHSLLRRTCPLSGVKRTSSFAPRGSAGSYHLAGVYTGRVLTGEKPGEPGSAVIEIRDVRQPKDPRALGITVRQVWELP